jgi:hypothetical protein
LLKILSSEPASLSFEEGQKERREIELRSISDRNAHAPFSAPAG